METSREWCIEENFFRPYQMAVHAREEITPDPELVSKLRANADKWASSAFAADNLRVENGVAKIDIKGVLLQSATVIDEFYAKYLGETYTTYQGLINQLIAAEAHPLVESIELHVDSPGGEVAGLDTAATFLAGCTKRKKAKVSWMAASAAYYLASQADEIEAVSPAASFGSIGVVCDMVDASAYYEKLGVKFYSVTSTNAPRKRQEAHSEEYKTELRARLDDLHEIFVMRVAEGRSRAKAEGISADKVNSDFGQGGMLIAKDALAAGMIDAITEPKPTKKEVDMSEAMKASQQQIDEAVEQGVKQERARVASLLPWMGVDQGRIVAAINGGETLSHELVTELSAKAAEKAIADAKESALRKQEEQETAAAEAMEADKAPEVAGTAPEASESDEDRTRAAIKAEAQKCLNNGGK